MDKKAKIYLAGHTGLVGSALMRGLEAGGYNNLVVRDVSELDLRRQSEVESFFEKEKPEYVLIAAAKVGGILANNTYKAEFIYDNLMIAANLIQAAYKYKVRKLLNLGSSCIYPKLAPQPLKEECLLTGLLEPTNEAYAVAKIAAIKLCRYYNEQYGTDFISVMPTNQYGPGDNFNLETAHVLPSLLRRVLLARLLKEKQFAVIVRDLKNYPLGFGLDKKIDFNNPNSIVATLGELGIKSDEMVLWGSGEPYREFLYVEDLARACLFLMEGFSSKELGELINIGSGDDLKIKDLAQMIAKIVGYDGKLIWDTSKPDGTPKKLLDVSRLKALGWTPQVSLPDGIRKVYDLYLSRFK